jgi:tRNA-splicing ligase RtcB (3'-phosphate/5'-hydroxy nucleic acid ligase)
MDPARFTRVDAMTWRIEPSAAMRVPSIIYADEDLIRGMDDKVHDQAANVAALPGIVTASYVMPDAHWGYGFPIGGVAAFDANDGGVVSAGGVGFDISCGVRTMLTGLKVAEIQPVQHALADALYREIPAGVGSKGAITLDDAEIDAMLTAGARWAVERGWGEERDLERIEEGGNRYLEVQAVADILDPDAAEAFHLSKDDVVITIHCGSRGLGHQIGSEYLKDMAIAARAAGIELPDRELACAPITSEVGQRYLGAMRAAVNCALANREILGHYARQVVRRFFPSAALDLLFDVSHNTCKVESHLVEGKPKELFVHRKGATRALGPGHASLPEALRLTGQPVLIGGSMGTSSYILVGSAGSETKSFGSACHGAGRALSRHAALKQWSGRRIVDDLAAQGIMIRSPSARGVAEEAPGAYKDVGAVVAAAEQAGLARRVARLRPLICIKG